MFVQSYYQIFSDAVSTSINVIVEEKIHTIYVLKLVLPQYHIISTSVENVAFFLFNLTVNFVTSFFAAQMIFL